MERGDDLLLQIMPRLRAGVEQEVAGEERDRETPNRDGVGRVLRKRDTDVVCQINGANGPSSKFFLQTSATTTATEGVMKKKGKATRTCQTALPSDHRHGLWPWGHVVNPNFVDLGQSNW